MALEDVHAAIRAALHAWQRPGGRSRIICRPSAQSLQRMTSGAAQAYCDISLEAAQLPAAALGPS